MAEVFICPKGAITQPSKVALRKAGIVVVEADDPDRCTFIRASEVLSADDMLWAALSALNVKDGFGSDGKAQREALAKRLFQIVDAKRVADPGGGAS